MRRKGVGGVTIRARIASQPPTVNKDVLPLLVDEHRAAELLGVSLSFLRKSRSEGTRKNRTEAPPYVAVGARRLYRVSDLHAWVDNLQARQAV